MSETQILIKPNGVMLFVYSDDLAELLDEGEAQIMRASHVEPAEGGGWTANMEPVGGPVLTAEGGAPFRLRSEALTAEVEWLRENVLGGVSK